MHEKNLSGIRTTFPILLLLLVSGFLNKLIGQENDAQSELKLWYDTPAKIWEEALPVGNGSLGAMVFGNPINEQIQFNEDTFWAGGPIVPSNPKTKEYLPKARQLVWDGKYKEASDFIDKNIIGPKMMAYLPMGTIGIEMLEIDKVSNFRRELDLRTAIASVSFSSKGITYKREVFSTVDENAIVIRLGASKKKALNFNVDLASEIVASTVTNEGETLVLKGKAPDQANRKSVLHFDSRLHVLESDGTTAMVDSKLKVRDATAVTLVLFAATNYTDYKDVSGDPSNRVSKLRENIETKTFGDIKKDHITEHQRLFNRFEIKLPKNENSSLPTNERLHSFRKKTDPSLVALHYQYGRYLLMCSSRNNSQPANLQGIWNKHIRPPWQSKYTININFEMNYWPAEVSNLAECAEPFFNTIRELAETGSITAKNNWGVNGWVLHHNTDIWKTTTPLDGSAWGIWPTGGAWLCTHLWEHYLFSGDKAFLEKYYPVMKESARFFVESLVKHPEYGYLVTNPSISPENRHLPDNISVAAGPSMDNQLIRDLFNYCIKASEVLKVDKDFRTTLRNTLTQLAPHKIGSEGQLQEWLEDWDMRVPQLKHRHVSHLYGLYPSAQFTKQETPDLWNAARKSLEIRGDGGTGWSLAWKISLWARLLDGDHAFKAYKALLNPTKETKISGQGGTYANLFDAHPPFQIDGNFGAVAGINEMLLQSHNERLVILPALPSELDNGSVEGIRARGGFELAFSWKNGELEKVKILSQLGNDCNLVYRGKSVQLKTESGKSYSLDANLKKIIP